MIPGTVTRSCPVCAQPVTTVRELIEGREMVFYLRHWGSSDHPCLMSGKSASLMAVAFTATSGRVVA